MGFLSDLWFVLAAAWVLFVPGWLTVELIASGLPLDARERVAGGFVLSGGWAALIHTLVLTTTGSLTTVLYALLFLTVGQAFLLGARRLDLRRRTGRAPAPAPAPPEPTDGAKDGENGEDEAPSPLARVPRPPVRAWEGVALGALLAVAAVVMLGLGGRLGFVHDSLDVVAYVADQVETDAVRPAGTAYGPDPLPAPDPRRGTFHTQLALIAKTSGLSAAEGWKLMPFLLVPTAVLLLYLVARELFGSGGLAWLAAAFFLWLGIFSADHFLQNIGYASRVGWVAGWFGLLCAHRWIGTGSRKLVALAALTAPVLMGIHILSSVQYLAVLGCLLLAALLVAGPRSTAFRRAGALLLLAAGAAAPFLGARLLASFQVLNPIFDHRQGLLLLGGGWSILNPTEILRILGMPGLVALPLSLLLWSRRSSMRGAAVILCLSWIPVLLVVFPPTATFIEAFHAHSLTFRLLLTVPAPLVLAWCGAHAVASLARRRRLAGNAVLLGIVAVTVILHTGEALGRWSLVPTRRAAWREQTGLVEALGWLENSNAAGRVVLSDPLTSYAIPAYTKHSAVAPLHQHSSPTDATALSRMREAQEALNGLVGIRRTCRILDRYGVDYILLNHGFRSHQSQFGMFLAPFSYAIQKAKIEAYPTLFERVYEEGPIAIYRYRRGPARRFTQGEPLAADALLPEDSVVADSLRPDPALPEPGSFLGVDPGAGSSGGDTVQVVVRDPPNPYVTAADGGAALASGAGVECLGARFLGEARPGRPVALELLWRRRSPVAGLPVETHLVFQSEPPAFVAAIPFQPFLRRAWETVTRKVYRFGITRMPLEHYDPPFLWREGEIYRDFFHFWIPPHAVPGRYTVHLRVRERTFTDNWELRDLFVDDGSLVGPVVGELEILPAPAGDPDQDATM